jgi:hypothetical protein
LENVIYGSESPVRGHNAHSESSIASVSYRNMCRYNSRTFYKHELMQKYKWYWRVE